MTIVTISVHLDDSTEISTGLRQHTPDVADSERYAAINLGTDATVFVTSAAQIDQLMAALHTARQHIEPGADRRAPRHTMLGPNDGVVDVANVQIFGTTEQLRELAAELTACADDMDVTAEGLAAEVAS